LLLRKFNKLVVKKILILLWWTVCPYCFIWSFYALCLCFVMLLQQRPVCYWQLCRMESTGWNCVQDLFY
jgi:hypothetical protein